METVSPLITAEEISARIGIMAREIERDYEGKEVLFMCTLKGAVYFLADLSRRTNLKQEIDFLKASSYGEGTTSAGYVNLDLAPKLQLDGKNVILLEDIVDTGHTAKFLLAYLAKLNPASLKLCSLLDKPDRRVVEGIKIDYLGFTIPDKFVVGYGLDYAQKYRNLPYIGVVSF